MRQLYVHIGLHKTGTTSIQWYLNRHLRKFAAQGLYVPQAGCPSPRASGHHNLAWTLLRAAQAQPALGDVDTLLRELEQAQAERAVISSEDFVHLAEHPAVLSAFDAALTGAGWRPIYILFLRAPGAYALSIYQELRKQGVEIAFSNFLDGALAADGARALKGLGAHLDFERLTTRWRAATTGELRILSYDAASAQGGVVPAFVASLGLPASLGRLRQRRLNVTPATASAEMREAAQWIEDKYGAAYRHLTAQALQPAVPPAWRPRFFQHLGFAG